MKKTVIAAVAALFIGISVNAQSVNEKTAKIENIKDEYTEKFSDVLVTAQNEVAINSIPMEYINNRIAK